MKQHTHSTPTTFPPVPIGSCVPRHCARSRCKGVTLASARDARALHLRATSGLAPRPQRTTTPCAPFCFDCILAVSVPCRQLWLRLLNAGLRHQFTDRLFQLVDPRSHVVDCPQVAHTMSADTCHEDRNTVHSGALHAGQHAQKRLQLKVARIVVPQARSGFHRGSPGAAHGPAAGAVHPRARAALTAAPAGNALREHAGALAYFAG